MGKKRLILSTIAELRKTIKNKKENHTFDKDAFKSYKAGWNDGFQFVMECLEENALQPPSLAGSPTSVLPSGRTVREKEFLIDPQTGVQKRNI